MKNFLTPAQTNIYAAVFQQATGRWNDENLTYPLTGYNKAGRLSILGGVVCAAEGLLAALERYTTSQANLSVQNDSQGRFPLHAVLATSCPSFFYLGMHSNHFLKPGDLHRAKEPFSLNLLVPCYETTGKGPDEKEGKSRFRSLNYRDFSGPLKGLNKATLRLQWKLNQDWLPKNSLREVKADHPLSLDIPRICLLMAENGLDPSYIEMFLAPQAVRAAA